MDQAEAIISEKIHAAFLEVRSVDNDSGFCEWQEISDTWIEENEDIFLYYSHKDELFLLPAFMCYLLRTAKQTPQSTIYEHISNTLREYSKNKTEVGFKNKLSNKQFSAVRAFIKHFTHNQNVNIDSEQWNKTLRDWTR